MIEMKDVPKKRTKVYTEQFTCRVAPDFKQIEMKLKMLGVDVAEIGRVTLECAFKKALSLVQNEAT